ncbi:CotH kinase family protein [Saccharicrinis sp. FJH54]|uniref:CotH kinase family protein n=1 Tax=Saccharicrinis sp. FJH54 TaxID=3344665 RepID=UPI0035D442B4
MRYLIVWFFILTPFLYSQTNWESIVLEGDTWKYLPATSEPSSDWYKAAFDDKSWTYGSGGFGYADNDDVIILSNVNSVYLRKTFNVNSTDVIKQLVLDIDYDDAFVCFLNGTEVARSSNLTDPTPVYNSNLTIDHEALMYQGELPERHFINPDLLKTGTNILAVQVINVSLSSSDMSARVFLTAGLQGVIGLYQSVPTWFIPPEETQKSNLPLILINTNGQTIHDEPKITVGLKVLNNPAGTNSISDTDFEYDGLAGIEIRGSSSQQFDKKSYTFETRTDSGTNNNVSLLGLPEENDWVLHGPYSDKSLMRNALAYHLGNATGPWSPRTRFCEVYINNDYRGVYQLTEKIKKDGERVNIATLNPDEISGDDLTGGYILKIDRPDFGAWTSPYKDRGGHFDIPISYVYPDYEDMPQVQRDYIRSYVTGFEDALHGSDFKDPENGYRPFVNVTSFIDFYLVNELGRNVDGYRLSTYFYKDKDSKGGRLTMGPLWDFNLAFGNADYYAGGSVSGWVVDGVSEWDALAIPFWWDRLRQDPWFESLLKKRWIELRSDAFSNSEIMNYIDSCAMLLQDAQERNFDRFDILSSYIWPNYYIGHTYQNEVDFLKNWTTERLVWMDNQIDMIATSNYGLTSTGLRIFPNPFKDNVTFQFTLPEKAEVELRIQTITGMEIYHRIVTCNSGTHQINLNEDVTGSGPNLFIYSLKVNGESISSGKLLKN